MNLYYFYSAMLQNVDDLTTLSYLHEPAGRKKKKNSSIFKIQFQFNLI